jgi:hypothetical protein
MRRQVAFGLLLVAATIGARAFGDPTPMADGRGGRGGPGVAAPSGTGGQGGQASVGPRPPNVIDKSVTAPKRTKLTCAEYRADAEKTASHTFFDIRLKATSWGAVPPELRKLPRKAKACGADSKGQVVIASSLYGKELQDFYAPLFEKAGFGPLDCTADAKQTQCKSKRHRDVGIVLTDQSREAFILAVLVKRRSAPSEQHGRQSR